MSPDLTPNLVLRAVGGVWRAILRRTCTAPESLYLACTLVVDELFSDIVVYVVHLQVLVYTTEHTACIYTAKTRLFGAVELINLVEPVTSSWKWYYLGY